jgi:ATP synthase protein I
MPAADDGHASSGPMTAAEATSVVLRAAFIPTAIVGVVAIVLAGVLRGSAGLVAAALAVVVVLAFFASGQYVVGRVLSSNPQLALSTALLVYLTQIIVLFVLIALLQDASWLDPKVFALTVVVCTLVWTGMAVLTTQRTKVLYVDPAPADEPSTPVADQ